MTDAEMKGAWGERVWEGPSGETVDKKQGGSGRKERDAGRAAGLRGGGGHARAPGLSLAESAGLVLTGRTSWACWVE